MSTRTRKYPPADDPILARARRRPRVKSPDPAAAESAFWRSLDLEKFAQDWRRGVGKKLRD